MLAVLNCYSQTQMGALTVQTPDNAMDHENGASQKNTGTIYDYVVKDISGNDFKLADLKGKKVMIVNTASECGFTPQYKQLEELYEQYKEKGLVIIGFPANNFGAQEPGDNAKIATFCQKNYGVTFPMMSKISVQGKDMAPLYQFLTQMKLNKFSDNKVEWNFQKYLIDAKGRLVRVVPSKVVPTDESIINWIKS
ncbi:MAG: glutathione peroxidase [Flavobacterium sp.]|nr:MAG: glutathione peroxidase [Flavobacterium sp.]